MEGEIDFKVTFCSLNGLQFYSINVWGNVRDKFKIIQLKIFWPSSSFDQKYVYVEIISLENETSRAPNTWKNASKSYYLSFVLSNTKKAFIWLVLDSCHNSIDTLRWYSDNIVTFFAFFLPRFSCTQLYSTLSIRTISGQFWNILEKTHQRN